MPANSITDPQSRCEDFISPSLSACYANYTSHLGERPRDINLIIRECTCRLCADIHVPAICCDSMQPLCYNKLRNTSAHVGKTSSAQTPESRINRNATCLWCPPLSVYASSWEYIQAFSLPTSQHRKQT